MKGRVVLDGRPMDAVSYALVAAEWDAQRQPAARAGVPVGREVPLELVQKRAR